MTSFQSRAILLAALLLVGGIALYFAIAPSANTTDPGSADIQFSNDSDAPGPSNSQVAVVDSRPAIDPDTVLNVDVLLWRANEDPTHAPNSRQALLGSGRSASMRGTLNEERGPLAYSTIRFIHGLNAGASAMSNDAGKFEFPRLYPGLGIVEIESRAQPKVRREVLLRSSATETLNINYANWGNVRGQLFDEEGQPIAGANVELDGVVVQTEKDGAFFFTSVVPGNLLLYFSAPGKEMRRETIVLRPGQALEFNTNRFLLRKAETLTVAFDPLPLNGRPPSVLLLPNDQFASRSFPFEKIGVMSPRPGEAELKVDGIPLNEWFQVRVYSDAGVASPAMRPVLLKEGDSNLSRATFSFNWKSPVSGTVMSGGKAIPKANIRIESCDIHRASSELLRETGGLNQVIIPVLPFARKESQSDESGNFRIEASETPAPAVIVVEAPGYARKIVPLKQGAFGDLGKIDITKNPGDGTARLSLGFQDRARRNVRITLDGKAQPVTVLPAGARLDINNLSMGMWGVRVREEDELTLDRMIELNSNAEVIRVPRPVSALAAPDDEEPVIPDSPDEEPEGGVKDH